MSKLKVKESIKAVFDSHRLSQMPLKLKPPPADWPPVFSKLADECELKMKIKEAFERLASFYSKLS